MINLKNKFYEDKETQVIMKEFYLIRGNLTVSSESICIQTFMHLLWLCYVHIIDNVKVYELQERRGVAEQKYKREADWKEAGEERSDERAWILSDNISGSNRVNERSEWARWGLLVLSAISYIINIQLNEMFQALIQLWRDPMQMSTSPKLAEYDFLLISTRRNIFQTTHMFWSWKIDAFLEDWFAIDLP